MSPHRERTRHLNGGPWSFWGVLCCSSPGFPAETSRGAKRTTPLRAKLKRIGKTAAPPTKTRFVISSVRLGRCTSRPGHSWSDPTRADGHLSRLRSAAPPLETCYQAQTRSLPTVAGDTHTLMVELTALTAWLRLTSEPSGAQVRVDSVTIGRTLSIGGRR